MGMGGKKTKKKAKKKKMLSIKYNFLESLVCLDLELNLGLP